MWIRLFDLVGMILYEVIVWANHKFKKYRAKRNKMKNYQIKTEPSKMVTTSCSICLLDF